MTHRPATPAFIGSMSTLALFPDAVPLRAGHVAREEFTVIEDFLDAGDIAPYGAQEDAVAYFGIRALFRTGR